MELEVLRFSSSTDDSLGLLHVWDEYFIKRSFLCFTLEDEYRTKKLHSETRIPSGKYEIGLRTTGGFHNRYKTKFGDIHKGMLHILDVPGFDYILIHCGNTDEDTAGCLLVGNTAQQNITDEGFIGSSVDAYKRIYTPIADAILNGLSVNITFIDYDNPVHLPVYGE